MRKSLPFTTALLFLAAHAFAAQSEASDLCVSVGALAGIAFHAREDGVPAQALYAGLSEAQAELNQVFDATAVHSVIRDQAAAITLVYSEPSIKTADEAFDAAYSGCSGTSTVASNPYPTNDRQLTAAQR